MKILLRHLLAVAKQDRRIDHALVPVRYERILRKLDRDGYGQLNAQEVRLGLYNPEMINVVTRFIVKHSSEWYEDSQGGPWESFFTNVVKNRTANKFWRQYLDDQVWMKAVGPFSRGKPVWHMHPVVFLDALKCENEKQIIFPLTVKPENNPGNKWSHYYWRDIHQRNMAAFGANRSGSRRKHAARDLYTNPHEKVVAICDGIVLDVRSFYSRTHQVTVKHSTKDGRNFIIRYGELDPNSIKVEINEKIKQNQHIGNTGRLINNDGSPVLKLNGSTVFMLHFEYYTGDDGLNINHSLTNRDNLPFIRRSDLSDPLNILDEGYRNTFQNDNYSDTRLNVNGLFTSEKGKNFIKSWEALELEAYNDANGFCTIGYGHLIQKKSCEDINLPVDLEGKITQQKADEVFGNDLPRFENAVKKAISVNLYQNEFDALVSLLFNCGENFFAQNRAPNLVNLLNNQDYVSAAEEFLDITSGGISGLVNRRRAEYDIFLNKIYNSDH